MSECRGLTLARGMLSTVGLIAMVYLTSAPAAAQSGTVTTAAQCAGAGGVLNVNWVAIAPGATIDMHREEDVSPRSGRVAG